MRLKIQLMFALQLYRNVFYLKAVFFFMECYELPLF
jgi:hypothetical protein